MTKARVDIEGGEVVFRPVGLARVWAVVSEMRAPLRGITSVRTAVDPRSVFWGMRWWGTSVPGRLLAGWMGWPWRRAWWCVGTARPVLVVDLAELRTKRIVVSTDDPRGVAARLREAVDSIQ
jgi:hypothetical protein